MTRFYMYDLSKACDHLSKEWCLPPDGLFEGFDVKPYFEDLSRKAYLIRVRGDIAGFVLIHPYTLDLKNQWSMGEFFILARYQGKGVGQEAARQTWEKYPGRWEVSVIPENQPALAFWEKAIHSDTFKAARQNVDFDASQPERIVFTFAAVPFGEKSEL